LHIPMTRTGAGWFLPDYENYTNAQFQIAKNQHGFIKDNRKNADYNTTTNSWIEQRTYLTDASKLLAGEHPDLMASIDEALVKLKDVQLPSTSGMATVANPAGQKFSCKGVELAFDERAAISHLMTSTSTTPTTAKDDEGAASPLSSTSSTSSTSWASVANPVGLYQYQTFTNVDYNIFLEDFAIRIGGCHYTANSTDDAACGNFRRPNVTSANPVARHLVPTLTTLWASADKCSFVAEASLSEAAHTLAGAPSKVVIGVNVDGTTISWDVVQVDKTATRLPESSFFSFVPDVDPKGWMLNVLGSEMSPTDVLAKPSPTKSIGDGVFGGSPHLRGIEKASWSNSAGASFELSSLDVPVVSTGIASPFISPRDQVPDMLGGLHFNIFQNIWNTNYVLWYPYDGVDKHIRSRFSLALNA